MHLSGKITSVRRLLCNSLQIQTGCRVTAVRLSVVLLFALLFFPVLSNAQPESDLIHYGDLIDVDIVGSTEFDWRGGLTPEGFLSGLQFTEEPVKAICKAPEEVASKIAKSYGRILNNPVVRVSILDRSGRLPAVIYGAVRKQQRLKLMRPVDLAEVIVLSGGLTDQASGDITILRQPSASCGTDGRNGFENAVAVGSSLELTVSVPELLAGNSESNPSIHYGDIITVERTRPVFLMGGVSNPSRIEYRKGLTLSRAISTAGGLSKKAEPRKITIFRRSGADSEVIKADYSAIESGRDADIPLNAYDIVDVAQHGAPERKYAPFSSEREGENANPDSLPLRVID